MSDEESGADKPFEASQKKLDDARKKGEIPKSNDLIAAGAYGGFLIAAGVFGVVSLERLGTEMTIMIGQSTELAPLILADGGRSLAGGLMGGVGTALTPWLIVPGATAMLVVIAQRGFTVSGKKLAPKASRISPLSNLKNKFGASGLFEFSKSCIKLVVISAALGVFLNARWPELMQTMALEGKAVTGVMSKLSVGFLAAVVGIGAAIGVIDFLWQYFEHLRKNRMSHEEMKDEHKQAEGDPYFKQERQSRGRAIATNQMMADVPRADVIIVNPEHYAVALQWDRKKGSAPICVAKGTDHIAFRIREIAREAGVPIHRDPPTARALHATTEIGDQIAPDHYRPVAAAIRFAEMMRKKAGQQKR